MKPIKNIFLFGLLLTTSCTSIAQKQTFDVVSYTVPKGWQHKQNDESVQLLATDNKTSAYAMTIITRAMPSDASASENFNSKWTAAIKDQIQLDGEPVMQPASQGNGWEIVTGGAGYTDNGTKGNVALLTATGGGQTVSVVIMTNSKQYEKDLSALLNSLELAKLSQTEIRNSSSSTINNSPLAGKIWEGTTVEKYDGGNMNGYKTGGYFTYQYKFDADGTYRFIYIGASAYIQPNLLQYETGTYSISGNKLTITPTSGANEEWSVIGGPVHLGGMSDVGIRKIKDSWGKRIKTAQRKLEKVTYTISTEYWKGNNANALRLQWDGGKTIREGNGSFTYYLETTPDKAAKLPIKLP